MTTAVTPVHTKYQKVYGQTKFNFLTSSKWCRLANESIQVVNQAALVNAVVLFLLLYIFEDS